MPRLTFALLSVTLALVACAPGDSLPTPDVTTTTTTPTTATSPASTEPATPSPTPSLLDFTTLDPILLPAPGELGAEWEELFALPYGDGEDQLGTSPGGEGLEWGPSYGTQAPDGTWWFLDTAHLRLAHFDEAGVYLGDAPLPEEHLAQGAYFQYQGPQALADGTIVMQSTTPDLPGLLRLSPDGTFSRVDMDAFAGVRTTDGALLFGFDEAGTPVSVDPEDGSITSAESFVGQTGLSYFVEVEPGSVSVELGSLSLAIPLAAAEQPDSLVYPSVEAATGNDGVLTLLVGAIAEVEPGEALDSQALLRINEAGRGTVEEVRPLTSEADPGDGAHLGVRLGDDRPWLMVVDDDALRVYRRG